MKIKKRENLVKKYLGLKVKAQGELEEEGNNYTVSMHDQDYKTHLSK